MYCNVYTCVQLNVKPWRRSLTMGNQCSEMKATFRANPEAISTTISHSGNPQPPKLADHFQEGPTKVYILCKHNMTCVSCSCMSIRATVGNYLQGLCPSTVNRQLQGRSFIPQNQAILDRLEPYMTTNNWYHRTFSVRELNKYPKKDVATYWQCEDYPKVSLCMIMKHTLVTARTISEYKVFYTLQTIEQSVN